MVINSHQYKLHRLCILLTTDQQSIQNALTYAAIKIKCTDYIATHQYKLHRLCIFNTNHRPAINTKCTDYVTATKIKCTDNINSHQYNM